MNRKVFAAIAVVAAMYAGYSAYDVENEKELTGLALANVEAIASERESSLTIETCLALWGECKDNMKGPWAKITN